MNSISKFQDGAAESCVTFEPRRPLSRRVRAKRRFDAKAEFPQAPAPSRAKAIVKLAKSSLKLIKKMELTSAAKKQAELCRLHFNSWIMTKGEIPASGLKAGMVEFENLRRIMKAEKPKRF
jgi:hypothetical protein